MRKLLVGLATALLVVSAIGNYQQWSYWSAEVGRAAQYEKILSDTQGALLRIAKDNTIAQSMLAAAKDGVGIRDALSLWAQASELCLKIPFDKLIGDSVCAEALVAKINNVPFPTNFVTFMILEDPARAIVLAHMYLEYRCPLVEGDKPKVCTEG
ncbi:MAG: hypothetical protein QG621_486 [Patescibacteria group bacterium]|nr:hypothetical protein [Patescibacteria group bacterium]